MYRMKHICSKPGMAPHWHRVLVKKKWKVAVFMKKIAFDSPNLIYHNYWYITQLFLHTPASQSVANLLSHTLQYMVPWCKFLIHSNIWFLKKRITNCHQQSNWQPKFGPFTQYLISHCCMITCNILSPTGYYMGDLLLWLWLRMRVWFWRPFRCSSCVE